MCTHISMHKQVCVCVCVCVNKYIHNRGTYGFMVTIKGNGYGYLNSNPGQVCILCSTNILGKRMNQTILPPAMDK